MRYFCSVSLEVRVAHERLARTGHVGGEREIAVVVDYTNKRKGQQQILGVDRLIKLDAQNKAELAILVSDHLPETGPTD